MSWMYSIYSWTVTTEAWPTESLLAKLPTGVPPWKFIMKPQYIRDIFQEEFQSNFFWGSIQVFKCERTVGGLATAIVQIGVIYEFWKSAHFGSIFQDQFYGFGFAPAVGEMSILGFSAPDCGLPDCGLLVVSGLHVTVPVLVTLV